jgi:protein-tyrosine phosphatase
VAQQFTSVDFDRYDYVLAMDRANRKELLRLARNEEDRAKVRLLRSFDPSLPQPDEDAGPEVPDPYYGGPRGFEEVFDICERACRGLLEHLRSR